MFDDDVFVDDDWLSLSIIESANLCVFSSFVDVCIFRFDALLYDLSFTYTSVDSDSCCCSAVVAAVAAAAVAGGAFFRSFAFWYSLRIST